MDALLDRRKAIPAIIGRHEDFLIVAGLGGAASDIAAATGDAPHTFPLQGAMGAACMVGLGLALAQPSRRILVVTGDGELLMNLGALATIAVADPPNLSILCIDNGHYGETGFQKSHTGHGVDLERIAQGAGIRASCTVQDAAALQTGARLLRDANGVAFVCLRVAPTPSADTLPEMHPEICRARFRRHLKSAN
jgi:phosphonopyruvate decarboxylase